MHKQYRYKNYDYSEDGFYFITICTKNRVELFGDIVGDEMVLSEDGKIAEKFWLKISGHFPFVKLDEFVIMPNHIHGIINIVPAGENNNENNNVGTGHCPVHTVGHCPVPTVGHCPVPTVGQCPVPTQKYSKFGHVMPKSISTIIGSFKSIVTKTINQKYKSDNIIWQPRFYDRIIRNENELNRIRQYIIDNPYKWALDRNNPKNF